VDGSAVEKTRKNEDLALLRQRISQMERISGGGNKRMQTSIPLFAAADRLWPEGGLPTGCLHEVRGRGLAGYGAVTTFVAALGGRLGCARKATRKQAACSHVLWCTRPKDAHGSGFYAPGLAQVGLAPSRLLVVRTTNDAEMLAVMEEGLRHPDLVCVIGEVDRLGLVASRRLQLAAEKSGVTAFVARLPSRRADTDLAKTEPIAAASRWLITVRPATPHNIAEAGQARWQLELFHSRMGATGQWIVEAPDAQGHLHLSSALGDEFAQTPVAPQWRVAAG